MKTDHKIIALSLLLGLCAWVVDAVLGYCFFHQGTFLELLIRNVPPHALYTRSLIMASFVVFGVLISRAVSVHEQLEREVKQQADLLQALLDNIPDPVYFKDSQHRFTAVSRAKAEHWQTTPEEMMGKTDSDFLTGAEAEEVAADEREVIESRRPLIGKEELIAHPDGSQHWYSVTKVPYYDAEGEMIGIAGISHDVTKRKQAEEALGLSEAGYQDLYDSAPVAYFSIGTDGFIRDANRAAEHYTGYRLGELKRMKLLDLYADESRPKAKRLFERFRSGLGWENEEMVYERKDGQKVHGLLSVRPITDENGRVVASRSIVTDITERKRTAEALSRERDRVQSYLDVAGVMLTVVETDETISLMNRRGCEILGYSEEELVGKNWFDTLVPARLRDEVRSVFVKLMRGEVEPIEYYENPLVTKTGEERIIAFHNTVLKDEEGNIHGALTSGEDITERKRVEEERERLIAELQDALHDVKVLRGLLPICAWCNRIRDDEGYWRRIESYISEHSDAKFTHGICPECARERRAGSHRPDV